MKRIGFVVNDARREAIELARTLSERGASHGIEFRLAPPPVADGDADPGTFAEGLDLVVSLGGDGTILRAVELVGRTSVPILGVNLGQLGYLASVEPHAAIDALDRVFRGDYSLEERMMLDVTLIRRGADAATLTALALNEAVLEKRLSGHTVRIEVAFDGDPFTPYEADALIISTPTGSTAYAFSARGPIIEPAHQALLLTPVSPHMLFDRSLVLDPSTAVDLTVAGGRTATLTVDGRVLAQLDEGDRLRCTASDVRARFVSFGTSDFHRVLKAKFQLSDR